MPLEFVGDAIKLRAHVQKDASEYPRPSMRDYPFFTMETTN